MSLRLRVAAVMFLCFFIPGSQMILLGLVLTKHGMGNIIGSAYACGPIACLVSPFVAGYVVDRYFSAERVLAALHAIGAGLLFIMPTLIDSAMRTEFLALYLLYNLSFYPTFSLMNNIAFHHVGDVEKMPYLRLFANVGWLVPGFLLGAAGLSGSSSIFYLAGVSSVALCALALTLPARPPVRREAVVEEVKPLSHLVSLFREPSFLILLAAMVVVSTPMALYYAYTSTFLDATGFSDVGSTISAGQLSELMAIALIPWLIQRVGYRWIILLAMVGWTVRYALFAGGALLASKATIFTGIAIHGICYDFLFVTAFIFTEKTAHEKVKAQAQGIVIFITYGLGQLIGSQVGSFLFNGSLRPGAENLTPVAWAHLWIYPTVIAGVASAIILVAFHPSKAGLRSTTAPDARKPRPFSAEAR